MLKMSAVRRYLDASRFGREHSPPSSPVSALQARPVLRRGSAKPSQPLCEQAVEKPLCLHIDAQERAHAQGSLPPRTHSVKREQEEYVATSFTNLDGIQGRQEEAQPGHNALSDQNTISLIVQLVIRT